MNVYEFLKLDDKEKEKYTQKCYPGENGEYSDTYDVGVFYNGICESCNSQEIHQKTYGTSDSREPKFCEKHFIEISEDTDFVKEDLTKQ